MTSELPAVPAPSAPTAETLVIFNPKMFRRDTAVAVDPTAVVQGMMKLYSKPIFVSFGTEPFAACAAAGVPCIDFEAREFAAHVHDDFTLLQLPHRDTLDGWTRRHAAEAGHIFRTSVASVGCKTAIPVLLASEDTDEIIGITGRIKPAITVTPTFVSFCLPTHSPGACSKEMPPKKPNNVRLRWKFDGTAMCIGYAMRDHPPAANILSFQTYNFDGDNQWKTKSSGATSETFGEMSVVKRPMLDYGWVATRVEPWVDHFVSACGDDAAAASPIIFDLPPLSQLNATAEEKKEQNKGMPPSRHSRCLVCLVGPAEMMYLHCSHLAVCEACIEKLPNLKRTCPYCMAHSNSVMKVYNVGYTDDRKPEDR